MWARLWGEVFGITGGNLLKINGRPGWICTSDLALYQFEFYRYFAHYCITGG